MQRWNFCISAKLWQLLDEETRSSIKKTTSDLNFDTCIFTHDRTILSQVSSKTNFKFFTRRNSYGKFHSIREYLSTQSNSSQSVILGFSDDDLYIASNTKTLLLAPEWVNGVSESVTKYGVHIKNVEILRSMLKVIKNQSSWYYRLKLSDKSSLIALSCANDNWASNDEQVVIDHFRSALKTGTKEYRDALLFHFLSGVTQSDELRKIDIWAAMPSSKGRPSEILLEFKEHCRYLTGKRLKEDLIIRNTPTKSSHLTNSNYRWLSVDASKHFDSMNINQCFHGKLNGKVVCVIDDYVTYGTTTEAVRALLESAGVARIIFVSIGRFMRGSTGTYKHEEYELVGDVYSPGYEYKLNSTDIAFGKAAIIDNNARKEVEKIRKILEGELDG